MNALIRFGLVVALGAGCGSSGLGGGADGSAGGGGGGGGDGGGGSDGSVPSCSTNSPSGYACDPWSTHLYLLNSIKRQGPQVRLELVHNPDFEGATNDMTIPPEHDYSQLLTVDLELTDAVRKFLCIAFTAHAQPASFDASKPSFATDVDPSYHGLENADSTGMQSVANLIDICASSTLAAVLAPAIAMSGRPALPDIALAIPLDPKPKNFTVGTAFKGWMARGILYVDEESELQPGVTATVAAVQ